MRGTWRSGDSISPPSFPETARDVGRKARKAGFRVRNVRGAEVERRKRRFRLSQFRVQPRAGRRRGKGFDDGKIILVQGCVSL